MEKRRPHYDLKGIQAQMDYTEAMNLTMTAWHGIKAAGMTLEEALSAIKAAFSWELLQINDSPC